MPYEAVIVTAVVEDTPVVLIENVAEELPAATVTDAGTVATALLLLVSVTTAPPVGAAPARLTVPCEEVPPVSVVGLSVKELKAGVTVTVVVCTPLPYEALSVTAVVVVTVFVVTVNVPLEFPAATVTEAGTDATVELLLDSVTEIPPAGAAAAKVTVPIELTPATTVAGLTETEASNGLTVNVAVCVAPP